LKIESEDLWLRHAKPKRGAPGRTRTSTPCGT
jgi:hypothetical protein